MIIHHLWSEAFEYQSTKSVQWFLCGTRVLIAQEGNNKSSLHPQLLSPMEKGLSGELKHGWHVPEISDWNNGSRRWLAASMS